MARLLTDLLLLLLLLLLAGCSLARGADLPAALHDGSHVLWGPALVDAAVLRVGAPSLAPLLAKLGRGEPVTVLAFGSSVVQYSFGSWWSSAKALHDTGVLAFSRASQIEPNNPGDVCEPQDGGGACRMGGVGTALMRHLNATWPHPGHALVNVGQPGGGLQSVLESLCVDALLPHTADLLLFEVSGGGPGGGTSPGDATVYPFYASALYHQMLHTLDRPAGLPVVLVHAPYVWELNGECEAYEASNFTFASLFEKSDQIDDTASAVAAYYGFSQLSLRNALWDALRAGAPAALGLSDCLYVKAYLRDRIHPTIAGAEFLGEALVRLFDVAAERLRGRAGVTPDGRLSVAEEAMAAPAATGSGRLVPLFPAAASTGTRQRKCIESHQMLLLQNSGWEFKWCEWVTGLGRRREGEGRRLLLLSACFPSTPRRPTKAGERD